MEFHVVSFSHTFIWLHVWCMTCRCIEEVLVFGVDLHVSG